MYTDFRMSDTKLEGGVGLVTGAGRGLGRAFSVGLAAAGMRVAAVARSANQLGETVRLIEDAGGTAIALIADVSDPLAVRRMAEEARERLGPIGLLINNAGAGGPFGPTWEPEPGDWWRCFETNMRGPFLCCREIVPGMIAAGRGRVINVASGAGTLAIPYMSAYVSSKAALIRFSETLAGELRKSGVSVFSIQPGTVRTAMAEELLASTEGLRWLPWFKQIVDEGGDVTADPATELVLFLASGKADALSGRFFAVPEDPGKVVERGDEVKRDDLYTLRMRGLSW
jgi:NAD(P)-dependent dehydrogenase (short-subunit alcohol dehydrogenase family)